MGLFRKNLFILFVLTLTVACQRKEDSTTSTLKVSFSTGGLATTSVGVSSNNNIVPFVAPNWNPSTPTTLSEIDCVTVFVGFNQPPEHCDNALGTKIMSFTKYKGFIARGQTISLEVPSGPGRTIYLVGNKKISGVCENIGDGAEPTYGNYSAPYLLAQTQMDLPPGNVSVSLNAQAGFTDDKKIGDCSIFKTTGPNLSVVTVSSPADPTNIAYGTPTDVTYTFTNPDFSNPATSMNFTVQGTHFTLPGGGTCTATLSAAGATCTVIVRYTALAGVMSATGSLDLTYTLGGVNYTLSKNLSGSSIPMALTVTPIYVPNGANWMQYVLNSGGGTGVYDRPGTAAVGSETLPTDLIHGGEKLKVPMSGLPNCTGVTISESLSAFDWECVVLSGIPTFVTKGLRPGFGLRNLISSSAWIPNSVSVSLSGNVIGTSPSSQWWTNPIAPLPVASSTSISLDAVDDDTGGPDQVYPPGTIFTINSNISARGYYINQDQVAIVSMTSATYTWDAAGAYNCVVSGSTGGGYKCMIHAFSRRFLWLELNMDGNNAANGLIMGGMRHSRIVNTVAMRFTHANDATVKFLGNSDANNIYDLKIKNTAATGSGLMLQGSYNHIEKLTLSDAMKSVSFPGIDLQTCTNNSFLGLRVFKADNTGVPAVRIGTGSSGNKIIHSTLGNLKGSGIIIEASSNFVTDLTCVSVGEACVNIYNSGTNLVNFVTSINNNNTTTGNAILIDGVSSTNNHFHQILTANSYRGMSLNNVGSNTQYFSQLAFMGSTLYAMEVTASTSPIFNIKGYVLHTSGVPCVQSTGSGFTNSCASGGPSSYTITASSLGALSSSFVGKVTSTDTLNTNNSSGTSSFASILDWYNFENHYRSFGNDGGAFPLSSNQDACLAGTCRIWDARLSSGDTIIRNRSGNGSSANSAFISGTTCPTEVSGASGYITHGSPAKTYLYNAMEISMDGIGDDNGLCESSEACIYAPNFGAYQGEGDYKVNTCTFQNGTVTGVTMYAFPTNGG